MDCQQNPQINFNLLDRNRQDDRHNGQKLYLILLEKIKNYLTTTFVPTGT